MPAQVAWANEFALAKPKKPMVSFFDSSTEDAAELAGDELAAGELATALETALELIGAAAEDAGLEDAETGAGALAAAELLVLTLELELVDDELQAARVIARAAVPAARSFVVRFTLVTP